MTRVQHRPISLESSLLSLCSAFNESLSAVLPEAMERAKELCGGEALTTIFDRGGWSTRMFEKIRLFEKVLV